MAGTTTKYAIPYPQLSDFLIDGSSAIADVAIAVDSQFAGYAEGTLGARPAAGKAGRIFRPTNHAGRIDIDTGSAWDTYQRASIPLAQWKPLREATTYLAPAATGLHVLRPGQTAVLASGSVGANAGMFYFDRSDFEIADFTLKTRLRATIITNGIDGDTYTFGLRKITANGGAANTITLTLSATTDEIANTVALSPAASDTLSTASTAVDDAPDGFYVFTVSVGATATGFVGLCHSVLEYSHT